MPRSFELDPTRLLVFAGLLEGCGYYGCKDDLKREYVPQLQDPVTGTQEGSGQWTDASTLEVRFRGGALRPPTDVDPHRFALLRYNVKIVPDSSYYCHFDVCYRELTTVEMIPESLSWDPEQPAILRLHFTDPVPAGSCEPWRGNQADFQALELIYLGVDQDSYYGETGEPLVDPDQLAYADDRPIVALGPDQALQWLEERCDERPCELEPFCTGQGGYGYYSNDRRRFLEVECP